MNPITGQMNINLPVAFITEGDRVIAYTPALDLSTAGKDEAEAKARFVEIVAMFFNDLVENHTLDAVLSDLGWQKQTTQWSPPAIRQESVSVGVPTFA
jgi:hypothetical protein